MSNVPDFADCPLGESLRTQKEARKNKEDHSEVEKDTNVGQAEADSVTQSTAGLSITDTAVSNDKP